MGHVNPALDYAENYLGVHKVHVEAESVLAELNEALSDLDSAIDDRRNTDEKIANREMELLIEERGKAAEISQAAMDRRLKEVYHKDETLRKLRVERNTYASVASGLELDIEHLKYRLKVKVARMEELGGYFNFLAAVKNAETSTPNRVVTAGGEANEANKTGVTQ
jgi:hypothetical protein